MDQATPAPTGEGDVLYTIEISALADGTFTVEKETPGQEGAEDQGGEAQGAAPQTAQSFADAMEIANALSQEGGDDSFNSGFGKAGAQAPLIREGE
jgi:hypothetical protein